MIIQLFLNCYYLLDFLFYILITSGWCIKLCGFAEWLTNYNSGGGNLLPILINFAVMKNWGWALAPDLSCHLLIITY